MSDGKEKVVEAYQIASAGSLDHARMIIEETLYDHPNLVEGWLLLADLAETIEEARQCYQMILELNPQNWVARQRMKLLFGTQEAQPKTPVETPAAIESPEDDLWPEPDLETKTLPKTSPTLKESFKAHKKFVVGAAVVILLVGLAGVLSWAGTVAFIAWKTNFLGWLGF